MIAKTIKAVILLVLGVAPLCPAQKLAIVGGTLIDLDNYGHSANDIPRSSTSRIR